MNSAIERLLSLRVNDVMNRNVVTVAVGTTMAEAARLLRAKDISGAPVVNSQGTCVGVLSNTDFAVRESVRTGSKQGPSETDTVLVRTSPDEDYREETLWDDSVETHMSPIIQTLSPQAPLMNAARTMCDQHIHRLIILDDDHRAVGIVTSLDIVAAMVAAIEE